MAAVSVIIPAYNSGATLRAALQSLADQTFRDYDAAVVDDGSTDDTADIVLREFPWVRLVRQANAGPAAARNRGAGLAQGEWLAFLDADDAWLPWRLEFQLQLAAQFPDVVLWCGRTLPMDAPLPARPAGAGAAAASAQLPEPSFLHLADFAVRNPIATTTVLLKRSAFAQQVGGFDERFRGPEDYDLWMRVAAVGRVAAVDAVVARYREGAGSLSMDDRRFLPQVGAVLRKAYGPDGVLRGHGRLRLARAYQYRGASWMARGRGDFRRALTLLVWSLWLWPRPLPQIAGARGTRGGLLVRYIREAFGV